MDSWICYPCLFWSRWSRADCYILCTYHTFNAMAVHCLFIVSKTETLVQILPKAIRINEFLWKKWVFVKSYIRFIKNRISLSVKEKIVRKLACAKEAFLRRIWNVATRSGLALKDRCVITRQVPSGKPAPAVGIWAVSRSHLSIYVWNYRLKTKFSNNFYINILVFLTPWHYCWNNEALYVHRADLMIEGSTRYFN